MILGNTDLYRRESYSSPSIKKADDNRSLFVESLDIIEESDRFFLEAMKSIHKKAILTENSNMVYLQEFNFGTFISSVIQFFIDAIKTIFAKFKNLFLKFTLNDNTISKYEKKIKGIKHPFEVSFERYIFTVSDPYIPNINLKTEFSEKYDELLVRLTEMSNLKTPAERISKMQSIESDINDEINSDYYNQVRRRIISSNHAIADSDYAKELFNVFRDGGSLRTSKIDAIECTTIFDRYKEHKNLLKETEKLKNETIANAKAIEKKINRLTIGEINKYYKPVNEDEEIIFNKILRFKCNQVNTVCNLYVMAFSAKCDAIKESAKQDKKILFEAIKYINIMGDEA